MQAMGATLGELLVTLAILALLLGMAAPGFTQWLLDARMRGTATELLQAVWFSRQQARLRGLPVTLCPSSDGLSCGSAEDWHTGWLVLAGEDALLAGEPAAGLRAGANRAAFVQPPFGQRATNGTIIICDRRGISSARIIVISVTGRPRLDRALPGVHACP